MIYKYEYPGGVWVDVERPSQEEIQILARQFNISERLETELLSPTPFPLVAGDDSTTLLVLHFPAYETDGGETKTQEVDFIIGSNFLITVRYEIIVPLHHLRKLFETQELTGEGHKLGTDILIEILFAHLYTSARNHANHLAENLSRVEREMFEKQERKTVQEIAGISREFLHLESAIVNQEEPLTQFFHMLTTRNIFDASFPARAQRVLAERAQVERLIEMRRAIASELRETNAALLETRQNEIIKFLTVITFVALPLQLIAAVFGMNLRGTPFHEHPEAFAIVSGIMAIAALATLFYFARKRWIF
jgi:magnesium/cobalt transport protein CorA